MRPFRADEHDAVKQDRQGKEEKPSKPAVPGKNEDVAEGSEHDDGGLEGMRPGVGFGRHRRQATSTRRAHGARPNDAGASGGADHDDVAVHAAMIEVVAVGRCGGPRSS